MSNKKLAALAVIGLATGCEEMEVVSVPLEIARHGDISLIAYQEFSEKDTYSSHNNPINEDRVNGSVEFNDYIVANDYYDMTEEFSPAEIESFQKHWDLYNSHGGMVPVEQPYILEVPITSDTVFHATPRALFKGEFNIYRCSSLYGYPSRLFDPEIVSNKTPESMEDGTVKYSLFIAMNDIVANYMLSGMDDLCISADVSETVTINGNWIDKFSSDPNNYRRYSFESNEIVISKNDMAKLLDYWSVPYD